MITPKFARIPLMQHGNGDVEPCREASRIRFPGIEVDGTGLERVDAQLT